jgi:hypothetical protein
MFCLNSAFEPFLRQNQLHSTTSDLTYLSTYLHNFGKGFKEIYSHYTQMQVFVLVCTVVRLQLRQPS